MASLPCSLSVRRSENFRVTGESLRCSMLDVLPMNVFENTTFSRVNLNFLSQAAQVTACLGSCWYSF
jgi:hypothetical protein